MELEPCKAALACGRRTRTGLAVGITIRACTRAWDRGSIWTCVLAFSVVQEFPSVASRAGVDGTGAFEAGGIAWFADTENLDCDVGRAGGFAGVLIQEESSHAGRTLTGLRFTS